MREDFLLQKIVRIKLTDFIFFNTKLLLSNFKIIFQKIEPACKRKKYQSFLTFSHFYFLIENSLKKKFYK